MRTSILITTLFFGFTLSLSAQSVLRTILIEDFAGHRCGNCPGAHYELEQLNATYGDSMVYVSIYPETIFSQPQTGSGSFETDFRVEEGQQIFTDFSIPSMIPLEMINREISINPDYYFLASSLSTEVPSRIGQFTDYTITKNGLMLPNRVVNATVDVEFVNTVSGSYSLINYLVEDSIIDWQTSFTGQHPDYSGSVDENYDNYIHHNVLRDVFGHTGINEGAAPYTGNIYGELLVGSTNLGDVHSFVINSFPMDISWNENQISIVII